MEFNKFVEKYFDPDDKDGFNEVIFARQAKIAQARERIKKQYHFDEDELDELFKVVEKGQFDVEKVRRSFKNEDYVKIGMVKIQAKIIEAEKKMQKEFEDKLAKMIKAKYMKYKKIKEELDKQNPFH